MVILGIISVFQMIVLPGLIFTKFMLFTYSGVPKVVAIFGISLISNYLIVVILKLCHVYTQFFLIILIIIEIFTCIWLYKSNLFESFEGLFHRAEHQLKSMGNTIFVSESTSSFIKIAKYFTYFGLLVYAVIDIVWMFQRFTNNLGGVFQTWDAVVSWNRWAVEWSKGLFPTATSYYPQLIPTNWSISYTLTDSIILQQFPKAIMPLFSVLILVMLFDLGIKTKSFGFFIGVILTRLMIKKFTGEYIADGYVDLPMTFFSFASIYLLLCARIKEEKNETFIGLVFVSILMAAGAALTKQAGVYLLTIHPLLSYFILYRKSWFLFTKNNKKSLFIIYISVLLLSLSWYLIKWIQIQTGVDSSNITYVTKDIYHGAGYLERAVNALTLLGKYKFLLITLVPSIFFITKPYRWLVSLIAIPFSIIWIFFFSYEVRNMALIFPIWGMVIGLFFQQIIHLCFRLLGIIKIQKLPIYFVIFFLILGLIGIGIKYPAQKLINIQSEKQWQIFNPDLNAKIRQLIENKRTDIKILTNYPVDYLPGLSGSQLSFWYDDSDVFSSVMNNSNIDYLLVPKYSIDEIKMEIQKKVDEGTLQYLFSSEGAYSYQMYKVIN